MRNATSVQPGGPLFSLLLSRNNPDMGAIRFSRSRPLPDAQALIWLETALQLRRGIDEWRPAGQLVTKDSLVIRRYAQYFRGIPVAAGSLATITAAGNISGMTLEFFPVDEGAVTTPAIAESDALRRAQQSVGARKYAWEGYNGTDTRYLRPSATLQMACPDSSSVRMQLCYVFRIYSLEPHAYTEVMISALNGDVVRTSNLGPMNCHASVMENSKAPFFEQVRDTAVLPLSGTLSPTAQVTGSGNTRYSGFHTDVLTDNASGNAEKPFRLRADPGINNPVITLNYREFPDNIAGADAQAVDLLDNDNNWVEYADQGFYDANNTLSGFDVHFNMQLISEYWMQRHGRRSWDDQGGVMKSYVNVQMINNSGVEMTNAYWSQRTNCVYFSRNLLSPSNSIATKPLVTLDICAHEIGHAVCQSIVPNPGSFSGGGLRGQGESGALNEGLSDIWGACMDQYVNEKYPPSVMQPKNIWKLGAEVYTGLLSPKARSLESPKSSLNPDTYRSSIFWKRTDDISADNDFGGIHTNCTVLGKWFNLVTVGGSGINDQGVTFSIDPSVSFGFQKSEAMVYAMEALLPFDASFDVAQMASVIAMESLNAQSPFDYTEEDIRTVKQAWQAVGVDTGSLYDMLNVDAFLTNEFTAIAVAKNGVIWAGTNQKGLYRFDGTNPWERCTQAISDYRINDLEADVNGVLWVAQSGREFTGSEQLHPGGGAHRFPDTDCATSSLYTTPPPSNPGAFGLVSRNSQQLFINNTPAAGMGSEPNIWISGLSNQEPEGGSFIFRKGGLSLGSQMTTDYVFQRFDEHVTASNNGVTALGGDHTEVWGFVKNNGSGNINQLLRYGNTGAYLGAYDNTNVPELATNFEARAIYFDKFGYQWVGTTNGKLIIREKATGIWKILQFEGIATILPDGTRINGCITGDEDNVYIATNNGLVVYKGLGLGFGAADFLRYTTANGLPSNIITGIATDATRGGIWLSTPQGIYFMRTASSPYGIDCSVSTVPASEICTKRMKVQAYSSGTFKNDPFPNQFYFEMSDANGSFENPVPLGEPVTSNNLGGTYTFDYPEALLTSLNQSSYWVRVRSTNPPETGISPQSVPKPIQFPFSLDEYRRTPTGGKTIRSNRVCLGPDGWDHYYYHDPADGNNNDKDKLLLSVKPFNSALNFMNLTAELGISNNPDIIQNKGFEVVSPLVPNRYWTMNRYWKLFASDGSQVEVASEPFPQVRIYYYMADIANINGIIPNGPAFEKDLQLYTVTGANANPDPVSDFANSERVNTLIYREGVNQPLFTYEPKDFSGDLRGAEFHIKKLPTGGGAGRTIDGGPINKGNVFTLRAGNWSDPTIWSNGVVPDRKTELTLFHDVTVNVINAICKTLTVADSGNFTVLSGANIIIAGP